MPSLPRPLIALALIALTLLTAPASAQIGHSPAAPNERGTLAAAGAPARQNSSWTTDNLLESMTQIGDSVYAGGLFSYAGPQTGALVLYNPASGKVEAGPPRVRGKVYALAADGAGGFFIGGLFSHVGEVAVKNLAHIRADMSLDSAWRPETNSGVYSLARDGERLYIGGDFASLNGAARAHLAAVSTGDGTLLEWNPGADSRVAALLVAGGQVYAGGPFANVGGAARAGLAALDPASGAVQPWDAQLSVGGDYPVSI